MRVRHLLLALLLFLTGCLEDPACLPESESSAPRPPELSTLAAAPKPTFTGRYLILLDRSAGMGGFVKDPQGRESAFVQALQRLPTVLRTAEGRQIEFWGVGQKAVPSPPENLADRGSLGSYAVAVKCAPSALENTNKCRTGFRGNGYLDHLLRSVGGDGAGPFRVGAGDMLVLITDLQPDVPETSLSDPGLVGTALRELVERKHTVAILGVPSSFSGAVRDLPQPADEPPPVIVEKSQPFFFVLIGPEGQVRLAVQKLTPALEELVETDQRSLGKSPARAASQVLSHVFAPVDASTMDVVNLQIQPGVSKPVDYGLFAPDSTPAKLLAGKQYIVAARDLQDKMSSIRLVVASGVAPSTEASGLGLAVQIEPLEEKPRLFGFFRRSVGSPACEKQWAPVTEIGLQHNLTEEGLAWELKPQATISLVPNVLYYVEQKVRVRGKVSAVIPPWATEWTISSGRKKDLESLAASRGFLGVGNLSTLFEILAQAQSGESLGERDMMMRLAFLVEGG